MDIEQTISKLVEAEELVAPTQAELDKIKPRLLRANHLIQKAIQEETEAWLASDMKARCFIEPLQKLQVSLLSTAGELAYYLKAYQIDGMPDTLTILANGNRRWAASEFWTYMLLFNDICEKISRRDFGIDP